MAGSILKTLTRDQVSGHLRELKNGEDAQSVFDEYHSEYSRYVFYNDKGEEVQNQKVIDDLCYDRADALEDEILFPESEMDVEIRTFANSVDFFESSEGMNYIMNRFTRDLETDDEDSEDGSVESVPDRAPSRITAREQPSVRDLEQNMSSLVLANNEVDDGYETPDDQKFDNDEDIDFVGDLLSTPGSETEQRKVMATINAVRFSQSMRGKEATSEQLQTCSEIRDILFNSLSYWRPSKLSMNAQFTLFVDRQKAHCE